MLLYLLVSIFKLIKFVSLLASVYTIARFFWHIYLTIRCNIFMCTLLVEEEHEENEEHEDEEWNGERNISRKNIKKYLGIRRISSKLLMIIFIIINRVFNNTFIILIIHRNGADRRTDFEFNHRNRQENMFRCWGRFRSPQATSSSTNPLPQGATQPC